MKLKTDIEIVEWLKNCDEWFLDDSKLDEGKMSKNLYPYKKLFEPIIINSVKIKNRIVMGPMGNLNMSEETGRPNEKMIQYFTERARGGVGLITSGLVPIDEGIDPSTTYGNSLSLFPKIGSPRTNLSGWRNLAESIHSYGSTFFIQLTAGFGRVGNPERLMTDFKFPVSASWNPNFYVPFVPCRPLSSRKINKIVKYFGKAALRSKAMQIDGVYLHAHEGYLMEQLANPAFNRRKFGKYKDWKRFGIEVVKEIRKTTGDKYPIMYRIDLSLILNETYGDKMNTVRSLKKFKNGRTIQMTLDYMIDLVKAGVDVFDVDLGCYDNWWIPHPPNGMPPGSFLDSSQIVKEYFKKNSILSNRGINVPIVGVGKLGYPDLAEKAIIENKCDMIMLARPLLADPEWANKVYSGRVDEIRPCIGDQEGCINEFVEGGHCQCTINPRTGFEHIYEYTPPKVAIPKRYAIVGAGPAGVTCACIAAERGHTIDLYEKNDIAGGMAIVGAVPKIKYDILNYIDYLNAKLKRTAKNHSLKTYFNTEVTLSELKDKKYDGIIFATGSKSISFNIEGISLPHVIDSISYLNTPDIVKDYNNIAIIGGGMVGCEIAHLLAYEYGKNVSIIELLPNLMEGICTANRGFMLHQLEKKDVKIFNCSELKKISDSSISILQNTHKSVPNPYITWKPLIPQKEVIPFQRIKESLIKKEINCDFVITSIGMRSDNDLFEKCSQEQITPLIYNIGDSFKPAKIFEATKAGYKVGYNLP